MYMKIVDAETAQVTGRSKLGGVDLHTANGLMSLGETLRNPEETVTCLHETCAPTRPGRDALQLNAIGLPRHSPRRQQGNRRLPVGDLQSSNGHASTVGEKRSQKGSHSGFRVPVLEIPRLHARCRAGRPPVDRIAGGAVAFEDLDGAFDRLAEGKGQRQALVPDATNTVAAN